MTQITMQLTVSNWQDTLKKLQATKGSFQAIISPAFARFALENLNKFEGGNRAINAKRIEMMVRDYKNGAWIDYHPFPIVFSRNGYLMDGQHRLTLVATVNKPVGFNVEFCDDQIWMHLDTNQIRSKSFQTGLTRRQTEVAGYIRRAQLQEFGTSLSPSEVLDAYTAHAASIDWILDKKPGGQSGRPAVLAALCLYHKLHSTKATEFAHTLLTREEVDIKNGKQRVPQAALLARWMNKNGPKSRGGRNNVFIFHAAVNAMYKHYKGTLITSLKACADASGWILTAFK